MMVDDPTVQMGLNIRSGMWSDSDRGVAIGVMCRQHAFCDYAD